MKFIQSTTTFYKKLSTIGKVLSLVAVFLIVIGLTNSVKFPSISREGYEQNDRFLFKESTEIYDDFYSEIYDHLVFNNVKDDYEIGQIKNKTTPSSKSVILDVGCGTGHHVNKMVRSMNSSLDIIGIDISPSMISKAKLNYPDYNFMVGNALDYDQFQPNTFTHILCLYFTLYYFENKRKFFSNCMEWLMPGGTLIVHVVNREKFDPILPPGNPLYIVSPQKYAKKRITSTKITFNEFVYSSDFELDAPNNMATFHEKFKFNDGKVRKQEHKLYMESETDIITMAQDAGFLIHGKIDLLECAYEYQYLYILIKPQ
jgi:ubiquinone/menaquinone biosynthesis C-methylase UbiE